MNNQESAYFAYDKEELLHSLTRFDATMTDDDVIDGASASCNAKHYHTVLLQVLLEAICKSFVQNEQEKDILLKEICRRLSTSEFLNANVLLDKDNPLRIKVREKFFEFIKKVLKEVIPDAEIDTSAVSYLESSNLSTDPDVCYYKAFEELKEIGRGGFGVVYKAKSKLTGHEYAVKKIFFKYKNDAHFLKVIREAKNFAALNHLNVVCYNNAWIEVVPADSECKQFSDSSDSLDGSEDLSFCNKGVSAIVITDKKSSAISDSSREVENSTESNSSHWSSDPSVIFSDSAVKYSTNISWTSENFDEDTNDETIDSESSDESTQQNMSFIPNLTVRGVLYIQMEYCDCELRFWLDERAKGNELPFDMDVMEIFSSILNGLAHIHSKDIIHRDLKPQNIFYSKRSNTLKIGDFGLATFPGSSNCLKDRCDTSSFHSANVGTLPYAAPEQIASKSYDSKVDIYSLGIILIELLNKFSTSMEFSSAITDVKNGKLTEEMKIFPHLANLVSNLISINPKDRMNAEEILAYCGEDTKVKLKETQEALKVKILEIQNMVELLTEKEAIIHQKEETIKILIEEIEKLRAVAKN